MFEQFHADTLAENTLSKVVVVRSDEGGEFRWEEFVDLSTHHGIKHEFTVADSPQLNGVAERAKGLMETAAMASKIPARELFSGAQVTITESLSAEASHWACNAFNHAATTGIPESESTHEMWYGKHPPVVLLPHLNPGYCKEKGGVQVPG